MGTAIPNPDLKPEFASNLDLTYSGTVAEDITVQTSVFLSSISDALLNVSNVQPGKAQVQNTGSARFTGLELSLKYAIHSTTSVQANYSYVDRKNITNPDILFTDVPHSKVFAFVQFDPTEMISGLISTEFSSFRYSTSYGTKAPGYATVNAIASFKAFNHAKIEIGANNILDANYMLVEGYPEEGRNFFVTLRYFGGK